MERQCDRHRNTPFTEDSGDKPPVAVLAPLGFRRTTFNLPYLKHIVKFRRRGCHRRPCLFSRKRKDRGEKSVWVTGLVPQYDLGRKPICKLLHSHWVTLRALWYAPPVRMALDLPVSAFEYVQSIETAVKTCGFIRIRTGLLTSRERSKKTEAVFLVGSREAEGKSKSPQARFLFATFSFGEAKEKVGPQSQICRRVSAFCQFPSSAVPGTAFAPPYRKSAGRKVRSAPSVCLGGYSSSVGIPVTTGRPSAFRSGVRPPP